MPSKESHLAAAKRNQLTIEYLLKEDAHLAWAVTVAFYKGLHLVEALLATGKVGGMLHTDDHKIRNRLLKTTPQLAQIWKMYRPLFEASLIARYLRSDEASETQDVFDAYMPRKVVESKVLGHYLHQLEQSVARLSQDPKFLD